MPVVLVHRRGTGDVLAGLPARADAPVQFAQAKVAAISGAQPPGQPLARSLDDLIDSGALPVSPRLERPVDMLPFLLPLFEALHKPRHASGKHCVDRGVDIRIIVEALGHESLESTKIYTQVSFGRTRRIAELLALPGG